MRNYRTQMCSSIMKLSQAPFTYTGKGLHGTLSQMLRKKQVQAEQMLACPLALRVHLEDILSLLCKYHTLFTLRCCDLSLLLHSQEVYLVNRIQLPSSRSTRIITLVKLEYGARVKS